MSPRKRSSSGWRVIRVMDGSAKSNNSSRSLRMRHHTAHTVMDILHHLMLNHLIRNIISDLVGTRGRYSRKHRLRPLFPPQHRRMCQRSRTRRGRGRLQRMGIRLRHIIHTTILEFAETFWPVVDEPAGCTPRDGVNSMLSTCLIVSVPTRCR